MNKKEIKKQIVESLLEGKDLIDRIHDLINADPELKEYYQDMKVLLSEKNNEDHDPGDQYFEEAWIQIEEKAYKKPVIIPFYNKKWIQAAAAVLIIALSFYLGTIQNSMMNNPNQSNRLVKNDELSSLLRKYNVTLTSFVNMDEFESYDLLKEIVKSSEALLANTRSIKLKYEANTEVHEILSELERILITLTHLKNQSISNIKIMQFKLQSRIDMDIENKTRI